MAWPHPFDPSMVPTNGEITPEVEVLYFDFLAHLLLKRRLARLSGEDVQQGLSAVADFLPVLPPRTVEALEQLLTGTTSLPEAEGEELSAEEPLLGVSLAELVQALPRKTLEALLLRRMKEGGSSSTSS